MARKTFSTTLEEEVTTPFKKKCDEDKIAYNDMIEMLMNLYLSGKIEFKRTLEINL